MSESAASIRRIVPYIHVADVQRSIDFYTMLGMECRARFGPEGEPSWASMRCPSGDLMLGAGDGPVDPRVQAAMFYVYTPDLAALRAHLLANGLQNGGDFEGDVPGQALYPSTGIVFNPRYPGYLPMGEMRLHDPDGYVVLATVVPEAVP